MPEEWILILVTGGAGYIGSHTVKLLRRQGMDVLILDNLSRGHRWAAQGLPLVEVDLTDLDALRNIFIKWPIHAVIHFAAFAYVGESIHNPGLYYRNNFYGTLNLLDVLVEAGVRQFVFSSTCATYGIPDRVPVCELSQQRPINPYGETKLAIERALLWYEKSCGLQWIALRYFNAAGADPESELGEDHNPETHLIPLAMLAALGVAPKLQVFGSDYPTPDGTAVRDYVHVSDLASAHARSLAYLNEGGSPRAFNLGTGTGVSVREIINAVELRAGRKVPTVEAPRREGDPPVLIADPALAFRELKWTPQLSELDSIIETAWTWHKHHHAKSD